jgi:hypothetical protein
MSHVGLRPNFSQVYIDNPDFQKHPLLRTALAERRTVELSEGETLYMPVGWWHEIEALGHDYICSVNRFWKVDPIWRYHKAPQAGFLYGLAHLYQLKNKIQNSFSYSGSSR